MDYPHSIFKTRRRKRAPSAASNHKNRENKTSTRHSKPKSYIQEPCKKSEWESVLCVNTKAILVKKNVGYPEKRKRTRPRLNDYRHKTLPSFFLTLTDTTRIKTFPPHHHPQHQKTQSHRSSNSPSGCDRATTPTPPPSPFAGQSSSARGTCYPRRSN